MVTLRAEHARLWVAERHVIRKAADVQFDVVMTVRISANDKQMVSAVAPHVGQSHGLVLEQKVRDCPWHRLSKRERGA
jgi:hypothetical protein